MKRWGLPLLLAIATIACSHHDQAASDSAMAINGPSIYPVAVSLRDERGRAIGLDVFRGHPVIVSMFYGSCPVACPLVVSHVKEVESRLPADALADVRVLLVSFDPARDTPDALAAIAETRGLDLDRWTLATGSDDDVRQVAGVLGVSYRPMPGGAFAHDSIITVLDREGRPVARDDDPNADVGPLVDAVIRARKN